MQVYQKAVDCSSRRSRSFNLLDVGLYDVGFKKLFGLYIFL